MRHVMFFPFYLAQDANYQNATACQVVSNLCALTLYNERQGRICNFIRLNIL